jgi:hypothetical protein
MQLAMRVVSNVQLNQIKSVLNRGFLLYSCKECGLPVMYPLLCESEVGHLCGECSDRAYQATLSTFEKVQEAYQGLDRASALGFNLVSHYCPIKRLIPLA